MSTTAGRAEWVILAVLIAATSCASFQLGRASDKVVTGNQDDIDDFTPYQGERFTLFDWSLFQNMAKSQKGNMLISPISLKLALVLLYEGAQEETAQELASVLRLPVGISATREKFSNILKSLQEEKSEYKLSVGTRIYMDESVSPRQRYGAIAESFYQTNILSANFSDPTSSASAINNFVKNITKGQIEKIIDNESSLKDSLMLIVSALHFKGTWYRQPFNPNDTVIGKFNTPDGKTVQVPYMKATSKFYTTYADDLNARILRIPYAGHKYSMFIVLPQSPGNLDEVLKKITPFILNKHIWLMQELPVDIMIPKFKFDFTSHLEQNLRDLGIKDIFDGTATLTGILRSKTTSKPLAVSDIIQKAGIEVSEKGTEAYVASAIEIGNKMKDETFHANQPFLFYIEDEHSGTILYMGVVNNPLEETGMTEEQKQGPEETTLPPKPPSRLGEDGDDVAAAAATTNVGPAVGLGYNDRQNFFNIELLQVLNDASPGNFVTGTTSVKAALMVLAEAASGQTRQQILSALRLPPNNDEIRNEAANSFSSFKTTGTELQTATKLWLGQDVPLHKNYTDTLIRYYKSELQGVNFFDVPTTTKAINEWVKSYTNGRISSLVDETSLAPDTRMLLTSAVYFKGTWLHAFDKTATHTRCFNVPGLGCQDAPLMESIAQYKYAEVPAIDAQVVLVPYTGDRVSMLVLLPRRTGAQALKDLTRDLTFVSMSAILASLEEQEVLLQLPKFSISSQLDLHSYLQQLGIRDLFSDKANLSAAFPRGNLKVNEVIHNAQIDVNEEGTIAAAVTGISVIPLMGSTATIFRADRPFLFFLIDKSANGILFGGRYVQPNAPMSPAPLVNNAPSNKFKTG